MGKITVFLCMIGLFISFNLNALDFGIRIQASDFIIPIMGIAALSQASFRNTIKSYNVWAIILVFTSVLILGAACHWFYFGTVNFWGIKKIIGWCICVGYFLVGISLYEKREDVVHALIITSWIMGAICLIAASFTLTRPFIIYSGYPRFQGFMGNPNAYGIFFTFMLILQISFNSTLPYTKNTKAIGMSILALNLLGSNSRTALATFLFIYSVYALQYGFLKKFISWVLASCIFFFSSMLIIGKSPFIKGHFHSIFYFFDGFRGLIEEGLYYSILERSKSFFALIPILFEHPITGIGLGGAMTLHHGQEQYTIHNTALWFLIEMGVIGFTAFAWFAYKLTTALRTSQDVYIKALIFPIISFGIASLANELFYQRYFWLFVGMIMCDWIKRSYNESINSTLANQIIYT